MKSYLRFLSRNKLYTAIEVVGLSVALTFVIILSSYIIDDMSVNKSLKDTDDIYICHFPNKIYSEHAVFDLFEKIPDIEESCVYTSSYTGFKRMFTGVTSATYGQTQANVSFMGVGDNFFKMFTFPLISGDPKNPFPQRNSVIISEELSRLFFPDGDAVGKSIHLFEENALKAYSPSCKDLDIDLTVAGIFKPFAATVFNEPDIIISYDYYNELLYELHGKMLSLFDLGFVRIKKGADVEAITEQLSKDYQEIGKSKYPGYEILDVVLTPFDDIKLKTEEELDFISSFFGNLRNGKLFGIYLIMCIFVTIVALLGYVVLTIAFSRFRIKEIATRQLLGTSRRGIIVRCFCEALTLLLVSLAFAVVLVLAFKEPVGQILGKEIHPLSELNEYLVLLGIIILMVSIASSVPSIILSSYSPVNIIKGEARYKDKILYGKIFVAIAGFLSIAALSICLAITSQTRHLINQELGYETEGVVFVRFNKNDQHLYLDELRSLPFVTKIGRLNVLPTSGTIRQIVNKAGDTEEILFIEGDREYFDVLGIEFHEEYSSPVGEDNIYLCQSTKQSLEGFLNNNYLSTPFGDLPVRGVVNDLKIGRLKKNNSGRLTAINVIADFSSALAIGDELCLKVDGNIQDGVKKIREFYRSKSYDDSVVYVDSLKYVQEYELKEERNTMKLITAFSICCLLMTIMTILGLSSYHSKTKEKDNAVRSIFGCSKRELIGRLILEFVIPIVISALVAIPVAYMFIDSWLNNYVIRIANSPIIYLGAFALVMAVVIAVISLQATRLMRTNPAEALKKE